MLEDALIDPSNRREIVIDPFTAAEKTGRVCCGIELDPLYIDVVIRRYQAKTGNTAVLADTGETFENLAARRRSESGR